MLQHVAVASGLLLVAWEDVSLSSALNEEGLEYVSFFLLGYFVFING
jgi:hypothetical protein